MADVVIAGAGIIGLSLALELQRRGAKVTVLEAGRALGQASTAAAGMLAVDDPANPPALLPLARLSVALYPEFLDHLESLSGERVAFQTACTLQAGDGGVLADTQTLLPQLVTGGQRFQLLDERSVDPRQIGPVLAAAVRNSSAIDLREQTELTRVAASRDGVRVQTASSGSAAETIAADYLVDCMGSWSPAPVAPVKGQMLAVELPDALPLEAVVRTHGIYIVPRTSGLNAGRAIIGATIERAGFDKTVHPHDILGLHARASKLLPDLTEAHFIESWAGLRPSTADGLPILGASQRQPRYLLATGHYRNGILLAPATARVIAQMLAGEPPEVALEPFAPERFTAR
jgi:glycine oxidase